MTELDRLPDEAIGLPSVFLQAGIPGVVGAPWPESRPFEDPWFWAPFVFVGV